MPAGDMRTTGPIAPAARPQRASASARPKNPRDHTGRQKQILEAQRDIEQAEQAARLAMTVQATEAQRANEVIDYTKGGHGAPKTGESVPVVEESAEVEIEVEPAEVTIRVTAPIEDMVFGRQVIDSGHFDPGHPEMNRPPILGPLQFFSFEEGRQYVVSRAMYEHLERLGYVFH